MIASATLPTLLIVAILAAEVTPVCTLPKSIVVGEKVKAATAASPVPVSDDVTAAPPPVNDWLKLALLAPVVDGENVTLKVHVAFAAKLLPQLLTKLKSPGFAPVIVGAFNAKDVFPVFTSDSVIPGEVTPTITCPKEAVEVMVAPV